MGTGSREWGNAERGACLIYRAQNQALVLSALGGSEKKKRGWWWGWRIPNGRSEVGQKVGGCGGDRKGRFCDVIKARYG